METTGMVGVGRMGTALLERLLLVGAKVTVYDVDPGALQRARSRGAEIAASAADVGRAATVIHVIVHSEKDVLGCATGPGGILEGARPGTLLLLHSTITPETTRSVGAAASPKGVHVMDACMLGMPPIARAGNERFLIGGPDALVDRATSHLLQIGKQVLHAGPLGTANLVKLANNLLVGCQPLVLYEAAQIAQAGGVPYRHALEVMRQLHTGAMIEHWEGAFDPGDDIVPRLGNNVFGKDLPLLADLAKSYGIDAPITELLASEGLRLLRPRDEEPLD